MSRRPMLASLLALVAGDACQRRAPEPMLLWEGGPVSPDDAFVEDDASTRIQRRLLRDLEAWQLRREGR